MKSQIPIRTLSLVSNPALLTAIANDVEYTEVFAAQLELLAKKGDLCLLISSSGKSANVVRAAQQAESMGLYRIGMTGFDGGELGKIVNVHLHVPSENYGVIEDAHQSIMHTIAQYLLIKRQHRS